MTDQLGVCHFGRAPIRLDWFGFVLPVLMHPQAIDSPFDQW